MNVSDLFTEEEVLRRIVEHSAMVNLQCVAVKKETTNILTSMLNFDGNTVLECSSIADMSFRWDEDKLMVHMKFARWKEYIDMAAAFDSLNRITPMDDTDLACVLTIVQDEDAVDDEYITFVVGFVGPVAYHDDDFAIETCFAHDSWRAFYVNEDAEEE